MKKLHNNTDISTKYAFIKLSEIIHDYFRLEGKYIHPVETEVITLNKRNLRMNIACMRSGNIINNIENQSYITDIKKLKTIAEYAKFLLINNDSLIDSIIISKIDPKYCKKRDTSYKTSEEILERLNKITN